MLEVDRVSKYFGKTKVIDQISVHVPKGKIYGLLGRNGAGKTTLIRIILGLIYAQSGKIHVNGIEVKFPDARALGKVGSIVEYPGFYPHLSGYENLKVFHRLHNLQGTDRLNQVLETVQLMDAAGKKVNTYSLGMKQRLGLARALLNDPDILILDEPTNGLDPAGMRDLRSLLRTLSVEHGKTIFLSSHILSEVEQIVNLLGFVREGKMVEEISIEALKVKCTCGISIETSDPDAATRVLCQFIEGKAQIHTQNGMLQLRGKVNSAAINRLLIQNKIDVSQIMLSSQNLEDYFLQITA